MLIQFSVKNFKSIKEKVTLDMRATAISDHKKTLKKGLNGNVLPVSVLYGPNGGGKSNVLLAISVFLSRILSPIRAAKVNSVNSKENGTNIIENNLENRDKIIMPFEFDEEYKKDYSEFSIVFGNSDVYYDYEVSMSNKEVEYEKLVMIKKSKVRVIRTELFSREKQKVFVNEKKLKVKLKKIHDGILALSYFGILYSDDKIISDVINHLNGFAYIGNDINLTSIESIVSYYNIFKDNKKMNKLLLQMLNDMDTGISNYNVIDNGENKAFLTYHKINNIERELSILDESKGTLKLMFILPFIVLSILLGNVLIIDELDARLHPMLLQYVIELYTNEKNKTMAQLIFNSHDMHTMTTELFRRDEVWFAAKNIEQATQLYSLSDFKDVRKGDAISAKYLAGKYGADPYLKKMLEWK